MHILVRVFVSMQYVHMWAKGCAIATINVYIISINAIYLADPRGIGFHRCPWSSPNLVPCGNTRMKAVCMRSLLMTR